MKRLVVVLTMFALFASLFVDVAPAGQVTRARTTLFLEATGEAADGSVTQNQKITLSGQLRSRQNRRCKRNKTVELFIDGDGPFGEAVTNRRGRFKFSVNPPHPSGRHEFQADFDGTTRCKPSQSNVVIVTVTGG